MSSARDTVAKETPLAAPSQNGSESAPYLAMQGIVKRFGATVALNGVDFAVNRGEIHALLGENGAGKSTLMHVLSGLTRSNAGIVRLDGREIRLASPRQARASGIAMVHQHFTLVPAFTVAENLTLDRPVLDPFARARALGWTLDPAARASDLPVGAQQRIEIVKALATNASLLIFDEPTAVLSPQEIEELFGVLRRLREEGSAVILIAHKLAEILAVSDRVTVLRRGHHVATCRTAETNAAQLAEWMVGEGRGNTQGKGKREGGREGQQVPSPLREKGRDEGETLSSNTLRGVPSPPTPLPDSLATLGGRGETDTRLGDLPSPQRGTSDSGRGVGGEGVNEERASGRGAGGEVQGLGVTELVVRGDRGETAVRGLSLEVKRGEIFGIGGVDGNGQTELAEALAGVRKIESGTILWEGEPVQPGVFPRIGAIPQDRRRAGLAVTMTIEENLLLEAVREPAYRVGPFLKRKALRQLALDLVQQFDIRTTDARLPASALSGGNQQKIVVARALRSEPELILAMNPTRGLDIGATRYVHEQLRAARARGAAIVLISTDLDELAALADRTAILSSGQLTEFQASGDAADIGLLLGGMGTEHPTTNDQRPTTNDQKPGKREE